MLSMMGESPAGSIKVDETEIDGVRCFWVDTGRPTLAASLMFRQGLADEPLVESGWLHILEHLALHGKGGGPLHVNGSVSMLVTSFDAHGPSESVASHFSSLSDSLSNPDFKDFERERGVLRAEAQMRGGPVYRAISWRYGARGPGASSFAEPGLARATVSELSERAAKVFARQNAAIILDGPPPAGLRLSLPDGRFSQPSVAIPCDDKLPAAYVDDAGVVMSGLVRRSMGATVFPHVVERALRERLRNQEGAAYAPWSAYERVDNETALVLAGSDLSQQMYPNIVESMMETLKRIDEDGLPRTHVQEVVDSILQTMRDPYNSFGLAASAANAFFEGRERQGMEELLDEVAAVRAESLAEDWRSFRESLLLGIPGNATWHDELPMMRAPSHAPRAVGRRFRHRDWPATNYELRIDDTSVQVSENGEARSANFEDVEAMISFEDGARNVVTGDGWNVFVESAEWANGKQALAILDRKIPMSRHLTQGTRPGLALSERMPFKKRWWKGLVRAMQTTAGTWFFLLFSAGLVVVGALAGRPIVALGGVVWVFFFAKALWDFRKK